MFHSPFFLLGHFKLNLNQSEVHKMKSSVEETHGLNATSLGISFCFFPNSVFSIFIFLDSALMV